MKKSTRWAALLWGALLLIGPAVQAAICQFNTTGGAWNIPANWNNCGTGNGSPLGTPGPGDRAEITAATVTFPAGTFDVGDLYLGNATLQGAGVGSTTLNVVNGGTIAWGSGFYQFNNLTATFSAPMTIPATSGPLQISDADVVVNSGTGMAVASIAITGPSGRFRVNGAAYLNGNATMSGGGLLFAEGGVVYVSANITLNGAFQNDGAILLQGNTVTLVDASAFTQTASGILAGDGVINAGAQNLNLNGTIRDNPTFNVGTLGVGMAGASIYPGGPGNIGAITVNGNLSLGIGAFVYADIGGTGMGQYDRINVSGTLTILAGAGAEVEDFDLGAGNYSPMTGEVVPLVTAGSISGTFSDFFPFLSPLTLTLTYTPTAINFTVGGPFVYVTNTNDSGPGSLRAAIEGLAGCDISYDITFDLGPTGGTIQPLTPLPTMNCGGVDGYSHPGSSPNTAPTDWNAVLKVTLDGSLCVGCQGGLTLNGTVPVKGINFTNWDRALRLQSFTLGTHVVGNYFFQNNFGVYVEGGADGIHIGTSNGPEDRNVFVHSMTAGIRVEMYSGFDGPRIYNNFIGLGAGAVAGPNGTGVQVLGSPGVGLEDNVIANNGKGLAIVASPGVHFRRGNKFFANTTIGVDVGDDGPSANDDVMPPYDTDANDRPNYPVINSATDIGAGTTRVNFTLKSNTNLSTYVCFCGSQNLTENQCRSAPVCTGTMTDAGGLLTADFDLPQTGQFALPTRITAFQQPESGPKGNSGSEISPGVNVVAPTPAISFVAPTPFPPTVVGGVSATQTITLTNTGAATLVINAISHSNASVFPDTVNGAAPQATHYCGFGSNAMAVPQTGMPINIAPMATCQLVLVFKPNVTGANSGTITLVSNAPTSPTMINLTGTGLAPPVFSPSATTLTFAAQLVSTTSAVQTLTITNTGGSDLIGSMPGITGPFTIATNNCTTVAVMMSCSIGVTFTPAAPGAASGTLTIPTNAAGSPHMIVLSGTGALAVLPTMTVAFAPTSVLTGANSNLTVTLSNGGAVPATITSGVVTFPPGLVATTPTTDTCGTSGSFDGDPYYFGGGSIPAMGSCTLVFGTQSAVAGAYVVDVLADDLATTIGNNANTSTATLMVAATSPTVVLSNGALGFGSRTVNTTSPPTVVTLTNGGTANLIISSITAAGDFGYTTTCPILTPPIAPLAPACNLNITFTPLTVGALVGSITIASNAPGSPHTITLTGTGAPVAVPGILVSATTVNVGSGVVGTILPQQNVVITNTGFATLNLTSVTVTGAAFSRITPAGFTPPNCGASVAPSATCQIAIACNPLALGVNTGQVSIAHNATGSPAVVALTCTGLALPVPQIGLSGALDFGDQILNTPSAARNVTITNTGTAAMTISGVTITGANANQFSLTGQCASLAVGASCTLAVTFTPTSTGAKSAVISIASNAQNAASAGGIALSGNGVLAPRPVVGLSLTAIGYGNSIFGGASTAQSILLKNEGGLPLNIGSISALGDFTVAHNCGATVAALGTCTLTLSFTPLGVGSRGGELVVVSNAEGSPHRVILSGTGCRWFSQSGSRFFLTSCGN
ncbi:MAG: choice-of-anchor D domain-containing protein [Betaproteobacteria bacterium]|nr:choice-of-anchor D domain-containing protein [Betaproteobacteria bacterium]